MNKRYPLQKQPASFTYNHFDIRSEKLISQDLRHGILAHIRKNYGIARPATQATYLQLWLGVISYQFYYDQA